MQRRTFLIAAAAAASPLPGELTWPEASARESGFDPSTLDAYRKRLAGQGTDGLLILRNGRAVTEWYAQGRTPDSKHGMASAAKALVGGASLLLAMSDRRIRASDPAWKYIPKWKDDPKRSKITIRHLATHTSGIEDSSVPGLAHPNEPGWKGMFWRREPDPFSISLEAPLLFEPGKGYEYSNPGIAALGYAVTASLRGAAQPDIRSLLQERVMRPLGIPDEHWNIGYGQAYQLDGLDLYATWGGSNFTPRAAARIAEWMMKRGEWSGSQLASAGSVAQVLKYGGMKLPDRKKDAYAPGSALCWYTNFDGVWPGLPRDSFVGAGAGHEVVLFVPSLQLVMVRTGRALRPETGAPFWTPVYKDLFEPLMAAMGYPARPSENPYPRSRIIRSIRFAPPETIVRQAEECDNWPITWADDGHQYTSYGDGFGFEPHISGKLGMGWARIEGAPGNFRGINVRTPTGERKGDGPNSAKASGLVMVDGVLYAWVRNVKNSQLIWSEDHAQTWKWGFRLESGFGSPAFLNYGQNYAGARDEYVYAYSQQGPSAYETDDAVVLARAPKTAIRDAAQWRFYAGGPPSKPLWAAGPNEAKPVFRFPQHCQRVDAVCHAASKRYLLAVSYGHNGGWGIFDAPTPWGPWTTAFHTEYWGVGETHGYRFSPKWISKNGREMTLIFSGLICDGVSYDAFCTRGMTLEF